ncbi:MAG: DUF4886 domain-containing protein [Kiritimatiellae bacterium]|nr:DUF4886 domain-containing protein [Kiritimatiellia bacterium]
MPKPQPTETRKLTYAETALLDLLPTLAVPDGGRVLVAGNRSGWLPLEAEKRWPKRVAAHVFDFHHARAVRDRLSDAWINPNSIVHCTPYVPEGPYALALFMTTPQSMSAELVLDHLEDIRANLAEGGTLVAAFEGDADDALHALRLVWPNVRVLSRAKHVAVFRMTKHGGAESRRNFASDWEASVPGGEKMTFTSLPGCFCHRRPDAGGLALAEVAAREATADDRLLDIGCGCGLVGLLVAKKAGISDVTMVDSHARAIAAAKINAGRAGIDARFVLSDDGLPRGEDETGRYSLVVGNPPYYSDYRIAEVFMETAYRALRPGGRCMMVVKTATGLLALQEKYFRSVETIKRRGYSVLRSVRTVLASLVAFAAAACCQSGEMESSRSVDAPDALKVLMIGNSFSICNLRQMPKIAAAMGKKLDIASLYIGGCSLERHWSNTTNSVLRPYRFDRVVDGRKMVAKGKANVADALVLDKWDVVTVQQASHFSWSPETYEPFGGRLVAKIRELAPQAKIFVQETWSYPPWDARLKKFGFGPEEMYSRLHSAYAGFAARHGLGTIPVGSAAEALSNRNSLFKKPDFHFNRDGEYLQGLVFMATLFRVDVRACPYRPAWMDAARADEMKAAAMAQTTSASGFTHEMPKATGEKPLDTSYSELAEVFGNPFGRVQTGCYWYWMAGNVSRDGVRRDLEAMKRAGIERPYIGDIGGGGNSPGPVKTLSDEWNEMLQTAFETATKLGMEIGLFNSPGWSQSGGPWVKPEQAMRRFVASSVVVDGPKNGVVLPAPRFECAPAGDMRDVCVLAYPVPEGVSERLERRGSKEAPLVVEGGRPLVVELDSAKPFAAQAVEIGFRGGKASGRVIVEVQNGGAWRRLCDTPFSRVNHGNGVGFAPHAPILASFAPAKAGKFRVTVAPNSRDRAEFASVAVCAAPLVERAFEKSLGKMHETPLPMWHEYQWPQEAECAAGTALDPSKAVVLSGKLRPGGTLDWEMPAGKWILYRVAAAPTGTKNGPANPEATGYEVDKMSGNLIASHFDAYLGKILDRTPAANRKSIRHAVLDSYEQGGQNFTDGLAGKFKASFGYDPTPYLPSLSGMAVGSRADTDRFLWDLRRFVADEVAYSYVAGLRRASNARGLETWLECYGHWGFPGEFLQYGGQSDEIGGEFWCEGSLGDIENRAASSCAHIYGKRLVWAESNTSGGRWFERGPMDLKQRTDRFFAEGINSAILHVYIQQADERAPGRIAWFGNEFNRHNTWFEHFDLFTGYIKRCGWMLRQGLNVADVAYFIGEDAPKMTGVADPALPRGRQFDYINAEVLVETASVDARGRVVLPHGTAYEVLVLPKLETMRPKMAECVERLVNAGAFVLGPKPLRSPSLAGQPQSDSRVREIANKVWGEVDGKSVKCAKRGKGTVAWGISLDEALAMRGSAADVAHAPELKLAYAHRTMPEVEIYFISNQQGTAIPSAEVSFRVAGRVPELWNAATGERRAAEKWNEKGGRTAVNLAFAKHESMFVVFPKKGTCGREDNPASAMEIVGPWIAEFQNDSLHRGPAAPVVFERLDDLSKSSDPAVKFYSGRVNYHAKFRCAKAGGRVTLDLGDVAVTAKVKVNGVDAGGVCFAPYRLDVTKFAKEGENDIEVEVCNTWVNRLVGDSGKPDRPTWTSIRCCDARHPLAKSGLLGPVRIVVE